MTSSTQEWNSSRYAQNARFVSELGQPVLELLNPQAGERINARVMDAYQLSFDSEFDAVFSNAALHWMKRDPDVVIQGVRRALKPDGRFAAEMGGHGCVAAVDADHAASGMGARTA